MPRPSSAATILSDAPPALKCAAKAQACCNAVPATELVPHALRNLSSSLMRRRE